MKTSYQSMAMRGRVFGALSGGANPISSLALACVRWVVHRVQNYLKVENRP